MAENKKGFLNRYLSFSTVLLVLIGLVIGASLVSLLSMKAIQKNRTSESGSDKSQFFGSENATVQGSVSAFDQNKVTIKNTKGESMTFALSPQLTISKLGSIKPGVASSSAQTNQLEKDQMATFNLVKKDGSYMVINALYF